MSNKSIQVGIGTRLQIIKTKTAVHPFIFYKEYSQSLKIEKQFKAATDQS